MSTQCSTPQQPPSSTRRSRRQQAYLGVLGTPGLTAYLALTEIAPVRLGDVVLVSAAAGAVGSVAGQLARTLGASRVIGIAGGPRKTGSSSPNSASTPRSTTARAIAGQLAAAAPDGIDVYVDHVGGEHLEAAIGPPPGGRARRAGRDDQRVQRDRAGSRPAQHVRRGDQAPHPARRAGLRPPGEVRHSGSRSPRACSPTAPCAPPRPSSRVSPPHRRRSSACCAGRTPGRCWSGSGSAG